jgi:MFS family permease
VTLRMERAHAAAPVAPAGEPQLTELGLATVLVGILLPVMDFFIVNVALPSMGRTLHAAASTLELVVAGYGVGFALLLVIGGRLGDAFGRRRLFLAGMAGFTVTSLACGLAPNAAALVACRVAQGATAAMMLPQVLATIHATTTGERHARALGRYAATAGIGSVVGQLVGGVLVSADIAGTSWRPIFLVNVPIGLVALVVAARTVPETRSTAPAPVDGPGTALLGVALLALLVPLTEGRALGWPAWAWALLAVFPIAAAAFLTAERRLERAGGTPLVPPSVIRFRSMRRGLLVLVPFFASFSGFLFVYAITLQQGLGDSALRSGLGLAPLAAAFLFASLGTASLVARYGRAVITAGATLVGAGILGVVLTTLATWPHLSPLTLAPAMVVYGVGQGLVASPLFGVILSDVPPAASGIGSGVLTTTQQVSIALGVASLGSVYLSLSTSDGIRTAFLTVLLCQVVIAVAVAGLSRLLPGGQPGASRNADRGDGPSRKTSASTTVSSTAASGEANATAVAAR